MPAHDCRIGTNCGAAPDQGRTEFIFAFDLGARIVDIGEDAGRSAKDAVLQRDPAVDRYVVLDLAAVADTNIGTDHHVLPKRAIAADAGARQNMDKVPDPRPGADLA